MFVFIFLSLAFGYLVQTANPLLGLLVNNYVLYASLGIALLAVAGLRFEKAHFKAWYDLFASSTLVVWFSYWKTEFQDQSPMFFFFPVYFATMTAVISLAFISRCDRLDSETLHYMRRISEQSGLQSWVIMLGTLGSLELLNHYQVFPVMVTLLLSRYALECCVRKNSPKAAGRA